MRVYLSFLPNTSEKTLLTMRTLLANELKKYYGVFETSCIWCYPKEGSIAVHIMDSAKYTGQERNIERTIKTVLKRFYPQYEIMVNLNYGLMFPNFNPCSQPLVHQKPETKAVQDAEKTHRHRSEEFDYEKLSENYQAEEPRYSFRQVILAQDVIDKILEAVGTIEVEKKVFDEWGLRAIIPYATAALSFYGPPGTGKSMAAEAVAQKLNKKILRATYADIESKFHGEGPKMVKAIFRAAERDDAILFLDESDSLLSKRLTNVSDGSAQAINSMRSQLLICLEQFNGIVIFATNLVVNYDKAFLSRLINIEFPQPDVKAREAIWRMHLTGDGICIPLAENVDFAVLADKFEFCGREIKKSVLDACVKTALSGRESVTQNDLICAAEKTMKESAKVLNADDHTKANLTDSQRDALTNAVQKKLDTGKEIPVEKMNHELSS